MNQLALEPQPELNYRTIPLSKGQVTLVDLADYDWLMQWKWFAYFDKKLGGFYATRTMAKSEGGETLRMHRAILAAPKGMLVDHRDKDTLNNRRNNLRMASSMQNQYNVKKRSDNKSGFRGVSLYRKTGKWHAQISVLGKVTHLGYYATPELASEAYQSVAKVLHGEFYVQPVALELIKAD